MARDEETQKNEWRTWYVALTRSSQRMFVLRGGFDWMQSILPQTLLEWAQDGHAAAEEGGVA
jgi:DNA helicase-2/ATP-dependent DNA helicase PcrA